MEKSRRALVATGALTAVLVLGGIGFAYGEPAVETDEVAGGWVGGVAHRVGGGLAEIVADLTGLDVADVADRRADGESYADIATAEGVDTADVKDAAVAGFEASLDDRMNSTDEMRMRGGGGPGGHGGRGMHLDGGLADLTDLEIDEILERRADGESLAQIAESEGVDIDEVIDAAIAEMDEHLSDAVENGALTEDEKAERLDEMRVKFEELVESTELPMMGRSGGIRDDIAD